jgi:hypothetical protein
MTSKNVNVINVDFIESNMLVCNSELMESLLRIEFIIVLNMKYNKPMNSMLEIILIACSPKRMIPKI